MRLIHEEVQELDDALPRPTWPGDFPAAVDAVIDSIYVLLGTLVAWGVDGEPLFRLVHEANMRKTGSKDGNGKVTKGPDWIAPDIDGELRRQGWQPESLPARSR